MLKRSCHTAWDYSGVDSGVSAVIFLLCISFHLLYPFVLWFTSGSLLLGESERSSCYRYHFLQLLPLGSFCCWACYSLPQHTHSSMHINLFLFHSCLLEWRSICSKYSLSDAVIKGWNDWAAAYYIRNVQSLCIEWAVFVGEGFFVC